MKRGRIFAFLISAFVMACTGGAGSSGDSTTGSGTSVQPLSQCIGGWWLSPAWSSCYCSGTASYAECAAADCQESSVMGYLADGSTFGDVIYYSATMKTMSTAT